MFHVVEDIEMSLAIKENSGDGSIGSPIYT